LKRKTYRSRDVSLDLLMLVAKYFGDARHVHYGYWEDGVELNLANLPKAQEAYCDFILSHIPDGTKTVLDVGCGVGGLSRRLLDAGYTVDALSPSSVLNAYARELLGDEAPIHECRFEDIDTTRKYDMIVFSESFQYVNPTKAFENCAALLAPGGHVLICDIFRVKTADKSPMGGGTRLHRFNAALEGAPFEKIKDIDITRQTGRTMEMVNDFLMRVAKPGHDMLLDFVRERNPWITRIMTWWFRKKLATIDRKYFQGRRGLEMFMKYKSYRLIVFKRV